MRNLAEMQCVPCRGDTPPLSEIEVRELLALIPGWEVVAAEGTPRLVREYSFQDFSHALGFSNQIGEIAEAEDHHPEILIGYGKATIWWWTHSIRGLHRNDFIMAARSEAIYEKRQGEGDWD